MCPRPVPTKGRLRKFSLLWHLFQTSLFPVVMVLLWALKESFEISFRF